ncbi:MAG: hypothetical protein SOR75_05410 [Synergistes jonesii]|uniref:hypothetical protein n=1 Tax=Synergistes jonesii TaxID=2754 RepID=UPI002A747AE9|nr:hypothetical protein [Synergistes jonesii]MDY2984755.1 hypothetical protein [Synergistes jonesii]
MLPACQLISSSKNSSVSISGAVSVYDAKTLNGYQIKGSASYVTAGTVVEAYKAAAEELFKGAATAKGALIITPEKVIVTTPGSDNKKEL